MQWVITWWNQPITWTDADKILVKNNLRKPFELNLNDCMKDFSYMVANSVFNSLWPSDDIWRHRSGSTLAKAMACCEIAGLPEPTLTRHQRDLVAITYMISQKTLKISIPDMSLKIIALRSQQHFPGANELKWQPCCSGGHDEFDPLPSFVPTSSAVSPLDFLAERSSRAYLAF